MKYYQHRYHEIEDYLHHRRPYLLVDEIISISDREIVTQKSVTGDEFFLAGHFPGAPIFPGAMMQELTTQSAGILIAANYNPMREYRTHDPTFNEFALGVLVKMNHARFKGFGRPGDTLRVTTTLNHNVSSVFDFSAHIAVNEATIMRNGFQLANVRSQILTDG